MEKDVSELKHNVTDLKFDSQGIKARLFKVEDRIRDLDDKVDALSANRFFLNANCASFRIRLRQRIELG